MPEKNKTIELKDEILEKVSGGMTFEGIYQTQDYNGQKLLHF